VNRRNFLETAVAALGAQILLRAAENRRIGLELYTVRNLTPKDYEGTIAKVAEIGYKEVEPVDYGGMTPKQYRAMLDKYGLTAPSTHAGATEGPDLEKQLEGFQTMGILYTEVRGGPGGNRGPQTEETVKRSAEAINAHGQVVKKFGMKMLIHNHTAEFSPLSGSSKTMYDVLLAETDPSLVAMQLDIGWASVAGQNILEMFRQHPGRFELWHVKDARGIAAMTPDMNQSARMKAAKLAPVGEGEVDYKAIFAAAGQAGMKHFCIEQDNAVDGDSMAAAATSYRNLRKIVG
jgi:sugar phosphate isomerase/epimerase